MHYIIDNYSRTQFYPKNKKRENGREDESVYLFSFVPIFHVEFIARYIPTRNHDNIIISISVYSTLLWFNVILYNYY